MNAQPNDSLRPKSRFQQMLDADPELAARCDAVRQAVREAAEEDIEAGRQSELITEADLSIVINARTEDMFR